MTANGVGTGGADDNQAQAGHLIPAYRGVARTLTSKNERLDGDTESFVVSGLAVRRLTPRECERLQGFPDDWTADQSDAQRYRQLGNAVAVPVAEWIGRRIVGYETALGGMEEVISEDTDAAPETLPDQPDANAYLMAGEPQGKKAAPKAKQYDDFHGKAKAHQRYYIDGPADGPKTKDGKPKRVLVPGATTVLGVLAKPYLTGWANKLGLQGINSQSYTDETKAIGTATHYLVECELKGETPDLEHFTPFQLERAQWGFKNWHEWTAGRQVEPILTEGRLSSEKYRYGGTVDFYGRVDGVYTLLDFKTSESIYLEHKIQATSYARLLIDNGHRVQRVYVIRLGRGNDDTLETHRIGLRDMTRFYLPIFDHCLAIYWLQRGMKGEGIE